MTAATPPKLAAPPAAEFVHRAAWKAGVLGAVNVPLAVIAIRFILLVAVAGAIALSLLASQSTEPWRWIPAAVYAVTVVAPIVWLSSRR